MFVVLLATLFFVEAVVIEVLALVANAIFSKQVGVTANFHKTLRKRSESIKIHDETICEGTSVDVQYVKCFTRARFANILMTLVTNS